jgi:hypothetical protein
MEDKEPLVGFHITDYDPKTEMVTIQIHKSILADERQLDAMAKKAKEAIEAGPRGMSVLLCKQPL